MAPRNSAGHRGPTTTSPNGDHTERSLEPARVRQAISQSAEELSCRPAVVLLHNPESTVGWDEPAHGRGLLSDAIDVLQQACKAGECGAWGISTWDRQLLTARQSASGGGAELVNQSEFTAAARRRGGGPPASAALSDQGDHRS